MKARALGVSVGEHLILTWRSGEVSWGPWVWDASRGDFQQGGTWCSLLKELQRSRGIWSDLVVAVWQKVRWAGVAGAWVLRLEAAGSHWEVSRGRLSLVAEWRARGGESPGQRSRLGSRVCSCSGGRWWVCERPIGRVGREAEVRARVHTNALGKRAVSATLPMRKTAAVASSGAFHTKCLEAVGLWRLREAWTHRLVLEAKGTGA